MNSELQQQVIAVRRVLVEQFPRQCREGSVEPSEWRDLHTAADWLAENTLSLSEKDASGFNELLLWVQSAVNDMLAWMRNQIDLGQVGEATATKELRTRFEGLWAEYDQRARSLLHSGKEPREDANERERYDVALSFAGEERDIARSIAIGLKKHKLSVFFDEFEEASLWGTDLVEHLAEVYGKKSKFVILFCSSAYVRKGWPTHERRTALYRLIEGERGRILPIMLENVDVPGLPKSIGYIDGARRSADEIVTLVLRKAQLLNARVPGTLRLNSGEFR